jgi:hypothetical protein
MAKPIAKRPNDEAERAFGKAWKLLGRIERRLEGARAEERKRLAQLGEADGPQAKRRASRLEAARVEIARIEGFLTELSELIASNARASSGQTVKDMAASVAAEIKDEAAEPPQLPARRRNRHHRPRRKPGTDATSETTADAIALPPPLEDTSAGQATRSGPAPRANPALTSKPASVAYRSLVPQPPGRGRADAPDPAEDGPVAADDAPTEGE